MNVDWKKVGVVTGAILGVCALVTIAWKSVCAVDGRYAKEKITRNRIVDVDTKVEEVFAFAKKAAQRIDFKIMDDQIREAQNWMDKIQSKYGNVPISQWSQFDRDLYKSKQEEIRSLREKKKVMQQNL